MSQLVILFLMIPLFPLPGLEQAPQSRLSVIGITAQKVEIPSYPSLFLQAGIEGEVTLRLRIALSGEVMSASVLSVSSQGVSELEPNLKKVAAQAFADSCVRAAKKSKFSCPACKEAFQHVITYKFEYRSNPTLQREAEQACRLQMDRKAKKMPPPRSTVDSPSHVTVRPAAWPCLWD